MARWLSAEGNGKLAQQDMTSTGFPIICLRKQFLKSVV
jgi:hypothetical protein